MFYATHEIISNDRPRQYRAMPVRHNMTIADVIKELGIAEYTMSTLSNSGNLCADVSLGYDVEEHILDRRNYYAFGNGIRRIKIMPKVLWSDGCYKSVDGGMWECAKNNTTIECPL